MKVCLVLLLLLLGGASASAEQLYLLFRQDCGTQLRYARSTAGAPGKDYFAYVFTTTTGQRLILETDGGGKSTRASLPDSYLDCSTAALTEAHSSRINEGSDHVFLLVPVDEGGYEVQPVVLAATLVTSGDVQTYSSPLARFSYSVSNPVIGLDLNAGDQGARVYFEGREGDRCTGGLLFTQTNAQSAYSSISYRLHPELGILQRTLAGTGSYAPSERIEAVAANGQLLLTYLQEQCRPTRNTVSPPPAPVRADFVPAYVEPEVPSPEPERYQEVVTTPATYRQTTGEAPQEVLPAAPPVADDLIHRVSAGETLYRISVRYGVDVSTLKQLNGLTSNTIYTGQQLIVTPAEVAPEPGPAPVRAAVTTYVNDAPVSGRYHLVQAGETVASLALRYGYTTARFREVNGLGAEQVALVGQRLLTDHCTCPDNVQPAVTTPATEAPQPTYLVEETAPTRQPNAVGIVIPPARPVLEQQSTEVVATATPAMTSTTLPPAYGGGRTLHVVQEGESLYAIARQYGVSIDHLRRLNTLGPSDVIVPFQKLYVN